IPRSLSSCANLKCSDTLAGLAANIPPGINQGSYRCTFLHNAARAGEIGRISKPSVLLKEGHCRTLGSPHSKQGLQRYISPIHESRLGGECRHEDCQCRIPHPRESGQPHVAALLAWIAALWEQIGPYCPCDLTPWSRRYTAPSYLDSYGALTGKLGGEHVHLLDRRRRRQQVRMPALCGDPAPATACIIAAADPTREGG